MIKFKASIYNEQTSIEILLEVTQNRILRFQQPIAEFFFEKLKLFRNTRLFCNPRQENQFRNDGTVKKISSKEH